MYLDMTCDRCAVAQACPKKGSSPLFVTGGKRIHCRILGGFGKQPVEEGVLSEESKALVAQHGPCLTIAEVPKLEDGLVLHDVIKIFAQPVLNERERPTAVLGGQLNPKGF